MDHALLGSDRPLAVRYDVALLDLDGVVYVGDRPVRGAPEALAEVRRAGMRLAFVTNNASRTPDAVATRLTALGVPADAAEVTTSAQAAAHALAREFPAGAPVLVIGGAGLWDAVRERGLSPVSNADAGPDGRTPVAVVQGFSSDLAWSALAEAMVAIRAGAVWLATNLDATIPSERGALPGNGSLVAALRHASGQAPRSTGKPDPTMHRESVERSGARRPIVVGDRLDTDVEGAVRAGAPSLLVLSGVTAPADLLRAPAGQRPDYVSRDVGGLLDTHPAVEGRHDGSGRAGRGESRVGRWLVDVLGGAEPSGLRLRSAGPDQTGPDQTGPDQTGPDQTGPDETGPDQTGPDGTGPGRAGPGEAADARRGGDDEIDALRACAPAAWWLSDSVGRLRITAGDAAAAAVLESWGLD